MPAGREPRTATWRRAALALFSVAAGTNVPTPLLLIYRDHLHLSPEILTAVFGVYAAGLVPALLLAGPLSDRLGRRTVVLPFIVLSGVTSLLFIPAAGSLPLLFLARWLQGVVSGTVFSVGSAWLVELSRGDRAGAGGRRAAVAMTAGFSLGPLTSGVLAEYAPRPTTLAYLVHVAVVVVGFTAALRLPETVLVSPVQLLPGHDGQRTGTLRRGQRIRFATVVAPVAVCVYAFPSVIIAALPLLVHLPGDGVLFTGVLAGITLGAGTLTAPLQRQLGTWTTVVGTASGAAGYALTALAAHTGLVAVLVPAALLLGSGGGLCLAAGISLVARIAVPERLGAASSAFYALAYLGFAAPFATAYAAKHGGPVLPLLGASLLVAALCVRLLPVARRGDG